MKIGETPRVHGRHLWYSDFGEGKTYLVGQLHRYLVDVEHTKGLYMFDFDVGIQTLRSAHTNPLQQSQGSRRRKLLSLWRSASRAMASPLGPGECCGQEERAAPVG